MSGLTVILAGVFQVVLEPPERLPCPPYVPLHRVVLLDGLGSPQGEFERVLKLRVDYTNFIVYITPVSDEVIFCDGLEN